jgi:hypothetical protein
MMMPARGRKVAILAAVSFALGCGMLASPAAAQSLTDRFKSLFGGKSDEPAAGAPTAGSPESSTEGDLTCPPVSIRAGASTYAVAAPARQCDRNGDQIVARVGIQGRVIAGPAGAPASVTIPLRVAVVQSGVQEKTIATKVYQTTVSMSEDSSVPFSLVAEDVVYPVPPGATGDSYIFYIGFDPQALKPEPKPVVRKKK